MNHQIKCPRRTHKVTPDEQNKLLRSILSDCKLNEKKLEYKLKAPFDKIVSCNNLKDLVRVVTDNIDELKK